MRSRKRKNKIEFLIICIIYLFIALFIAFAKRPMVSEIENRKLEEFPKKFSKEEFLSGDYFDKISNWFSDTVPYRDTFLALSYKLKEYNGFATKIDMRNYVPVKHINEEVRATKSTASASVVLKQMLENSISTKSEVIATKSEQDLNVAINDYYKENGLIIFEDAGSIRAVEEFPGFRNGDETYSYTVNLYKEVMPQVNVYSMIIPTAIAYYAPEELKANIPSEEAFINIINSFLNESIINVDVYHTLLKHIDEDIYLRTDHHWSPLGVYYAVEEFAKKAGVNYNILDTYEKVSLKRYQGSLYKLSGNERLKDSREPFTYYVPQNVAYTVLENSYTLDSNRVPTGKKGFKDNGAYFIVNADGIGNGYSVYMGSDNKTVVLKMPVNNTGRNLLLLKDSFGNPIPSFLMSSFDNIHIVDYRYFLDNIVVYVSENKITDVLFANNVMNVKSDHAASKYRELLIQGLEKNGQ